MTSQVEHALCQRPVRRALCMHYVYANVDAVVGFVGKRKKMEENILNLSFEVDTYEEEEVGGDIDSSDSDNNDGDLGELTLNADNAVACGWTGVLRVPELGPGAAGRDSWPLDGDDNDEPRRNEDMSWLDPNNTLDSDKM